MEAACKINWAASPEGIVSLHVLTNAEGKSTCQVKWNAPGKAVVTAFVGNVSAKCSFITTSYSLFDIAEGDTVLMDEGGNVAGSVRVVLYVDQRLQAGRQLAVAVHDASSGAIDAQGVASPATAYRFWFPKLGAGTFKVRGGSDLDGDGFACEGGDACGWFGGDTQAEAEIVDLDAQPTVMGADVFPRHP